MSTGSLQVNRDIILATRRQYLEKRRAHTPPEAALAMAQMQNRPRPVLDVVTDHERILLIAQIRRHQVYDPVTSALHCVVNGAQAVSIFTDHTLYEHDLDDMLMVSRGMRETPVIYQNYVLNNYAVTVARSSDASALFFYTTVLDPDTLRKTISLAQRWKMTIILQVASADALLLARDTSPHVIAVGDHTEHMFQKCVELAHLARTWDEVPSHTRLMFTRAAESLEELEQMLQAPIDAVMVRENLLKDARLAKKVQKMIASAEEQRRSSYS